MRERGELSMRERATHERELRMTRERTEDVRERELSMREI